MNTELEGAPTGRVCASLSFAKKAMCSKAGQPMARKIGVGCHGTNREVGDIRAISQGMSALSCAFLLEIHSWFRRGLVGSKSSPPHPWRR